MAELKTNLLTEDDIAFIHEHGISEKARGDLFVRAAGNTLMLTLKGTQYVKYVCHVYGFDFFGLSLSTDLDVLRFANRVNGAILETIDTKLTEELSSNSVPLQSREHARAYLSGNLDASMAAAKRLTECSAAGNHVIPVQFMK